jgi:Na+-driven multidrug efflux pump
MKKRQEIQLSDHFGYGRLIKFVIPSVMMMIFTSIYSIVDGFFVSNFVNKTAFAAVNLIMPLLMILGAVGFMIGTGGTAIVAKTMGMGDKVLANRYFSFLTYFTIISGVILAVLGIVFARPVAHLLGAEGEILDYCVLYARLVLLGLPFFMLQNVFQSFFITAEKPKLGLWVIVAAGVTNMVLDALLVAVFQLGLAGAALATAISQLVGGVIPLIYFGRKNTSTLKLGKTEFCGNFRYGKLSFF